MIIAKTIAPVTLAVRLASLGRRLWSPDESLRDALVRTHRVLLMIGVIALLVGIQSDTGTHVDGAA